MFKLKIMKLDILAFGVHPDDVDLFCSGTILKHLSIGHKCGIIDLTQGELGTRGSAELRLKEAKDAAIVLGVEVRENLKMNDGFFINDQKHQQLIIEKIRQYQPDIILCNALEDRHPDHARASSLVSDASFYSGLVKIKTVLNGKEQKPWRPKVVYHYIQDTNLKPDLIIDVSEFVETKMNAIKTFKSQFYDSKSKEPQTPISVDNFFEVIKGKMAVNGRAAGFKYGEAYTVERTIGVKSLFDIV
jgi:bacillithiol biosynthesis deacetylase BshB1